MRDLDPSRNGYVTSEELEELFKSIYPKQLNSVNLIKVFKPFASIQNKLLIDYERVRRALQKSIICARSKK